MYLDFSEETKGPFKYSSDICTGVEEEKRALLPSTEYIMKETGCGIYLGKL